MPYQVLSHTADSGIEASAGTLADLIAEMATGMFDLMAPSTPGDEGVPVEIELQASTVEDLVVDVLSELLYESEAGDLILTDFRVTMPDTNHARVTARGVAMSKTEMSGPPIKAVTYHDLVVEERPDGWFGRVYFDV